MKLGMFMMPFHSMTHSYREMYRQDIEAAIWADRCGFDELWLGEHYSAKVEPICNTLRFFMSALIPQTRQIKLCTGVLNLPQHHPAKIASDMAMFDNMSDGRFIAGIGPGGLGSDLEMFGTIDKNRNAMMAECAAMIRQNYGTAMHPFRFDGEFWKFGLEKAIHHDLGIGLLPKPLPQPFPQFCISAMSPHSDTAKLAGEQGWHLISANFNAPWIVRSHWDVYTAAALAAGHHIPLDTWRICRSIIVTSTKAQAEAFIADPDNSITSYYRYMVTLLRRTGRGRIRTLMAHPDMTEDDVTLESCLDFMVITGTPKWSPTS